MKKILTYISIVTISVLISLLVSFILFQKKEKPTGYIELGKVYDEFELSKNLNAQFQTTATERKNYLDSLEFQVKNMYNQVSRNSEDKKLVETFELAQRQYLYQKEQIESAVSKLEEQYNEQIWTQLNEYIKQYGKEKGYAYIFGAEGSGTLMYANEGKNVTQEMINYINDKYQGT